jgi:hypothetical protein
MMDDADGVSPAAPTTPGSPSPTTIATSPPVSTRSIMVIRLPAPIIQLLPGAYS